MNTPTTTAAAIRAEFGYSSAPLILCDVYQHTNGKQYHACKRMRADWALICGRTNDAGTISLFPVNAKTGRAWQAARYFNPTDVRLIGTIEI